MVADHKLRLQMSNQNWERTTHFWERVETVLYSRRKQSSLMKWMHCKCFRNPDYWYHKSQWNKEQSVTYWPTGDLTSYTHQALLLPPSHHGRHCRSQPCCTVLFPGCTNLRNVQCCKTPWCTPSFRARLLPWRANLTSKRYFKVLNIYQKGTHQLRRSLLFKYFWLRIAVWLPVLKPPTQIYRGANFS